MHYKITLKCVFFSFPYNSSAIHDEYSSNSPLSTPILSTFSVKTIT